MPATNRPVRLDDITLQLCEPRAAAFTRPGWIWELKLDGFRVLAERSQQDVRLAYRRGRDATGHFPEITEAIAALPAEDFILDGELVIQDPEGNPIFQKLLERSTLTGSQIRYMASTSPAVFFAFDLLRLNGNDLRELSVRDRKALLRQLLPNDGRVRIVDHVEEQGEALLEAVRVKGLEGIVGKRADAPYRGGRGPDWVKVAFTSTCDFAVVGYAEELGALHLGVHDSNGFVYAGKVGAGFGPKQQKDVSAQLQALRRDEPGCRGPLTEDKDVVWTNPVMVVEVRYKNWPAGLAPREPVLLRFRQDKAPEECVAPEGAVPVSLASAPLPEPQVRLSNPQKIYFPAEGITKGQIFNYYREVSPWLLPYLRDRPLMMTRYPDGITGKNFFQKSKPNKGAPDWLRTIPVHNEEEQRDFEQVVCDDLRTLEWVANMGTLPLHLPAGRVANLGLADWCVIDFDPKEASFAHVITLANELHRICEGAALPAFVKTTGSSGLHVLIPLGAQVDHAFAVQLAELLGSMIVQRHPQLATMERVVSKRAGRVYVDCYQNGNGKLIAAPFCVRAQPGAPVSMPLAWSEVKKGLGPQQFTIANAIARLEKKGDPMAEVRTIRPALDVALTRLAGA
jgi:bifunctional non-homologous end joining protein LigD